MKKYAAFLLFLLLCSCGFHLRGFGASSHPLPYSIWTIENGADMQRALQSVLMRKDKVAGESRAVLSVHESVRQKDIETINRFGAVNEYLLRLRVTVTVRPEVGEESEPITVVIRRNMHYSENEKLGKETEEQMIWEDMRQDAAEQIMRRIEKLLQDS